MDNHTSLVSPDAETGAAAPHRAEQRFLVARLLIPAPTLTPEATSGEAYNLLTRQAELPGIAVVDRGEIVGYVDRSSLLKRYARHLMRDYYVRRPISLVLDKNPLCIEMDAPIRVLAERISHEKPEALSSGFVITRNGCYLGVGTALDMMKASVEEVQFRSRQLAESQRAAEQANTAKTMFLANMSHEFRTPLNAIIGFAEVLQTLRFGPLTEKQDKYIEDIRASGAHLHELISDVLDLSKAEFGKLELHEDAFPLNDWIDGCLRLVHGRADTTGVLLRKTILTPPVELLVDRVKARQILTNLLSNAIKFAPEGRVDITARLLDDGALEISVADTGIGMSPEQIPMALEAFVQLDNSRNWSHKGTGLGLPLCKQLIELHGGRLHVESALGKGTTMRVTIPQERVKLI